MSYQMPVATDCKLLAGKSAIPVALAATTTCS
jgi:hypothetical protein